MGYMRHHVIIVTGIDIDDRTERAHKIARDIFPVVSSILKSQMNGYKSFFIPPDGSKEGWEESDEGDKRRDRFIEQLKKHLAYEGGEGFKVTWCEVQYYDDGGDDRITRASFPVCPKES